MSIALFFITHEAIASNLLNIGESIIRKPNNNLSFLEVPMDTDFDTMINSIQSKLNKLNLNRYIIFITDIYGGTPSNIAQLLATSYDANLISGVNLLMIIRLLNYRNETEQVLIQKALDGAHKGVQVNISR